MVRLKKETKDSLIPITRNCEVACLTNSQKTLWNTLIQT